MGSSRMVVRLDRVTCINGWIDMLPSSFFQYLHHSTSDHSPMLLRLIEQKKSYHKTFRYFNYWANYAGLEQVVKDTWESTVDGHWQYQVVVKLKKLKYAIKIWKEQTKAPPPK